MPKVSLHTAVKGQFGLGTGRAMGNALKAIVVKYVYWQSIQKEKDAVTATSASCIESTVCHELAASGT